MVDPTGVLAEGQCERVGAVPFDIDDRDDSVDHATDPGSRCQLLKLDAHLVHAGCDGAPLAFAHDPPVSIASAGNELKAITRKTMSVTLCHRTRTFGPPEPYEPPTRGMGAVIIARSVPCRLGR